MKLTDTLQNYLNTATNTRNNILFTDLKEILLSYTNNMNDYFLHKSLSNAILELISIWKEKKSFDNNFIMTNENFKNIIDNDSTPYSAQMIFPIYHNGNLDGFLIFLEQQISILNLVLKPPLLLENLRKFLVIIIIKRKENNFMEKLKKELENNNTENDKTENVTQQAEKIISINEEHLFNKADLGFMREILEKHKRNLDNVDGYKKLVRKLYRIANRIEETDYKTYELFNDYFTTENSMAEYELCLMFYLGFKKGLEVKKME